MSVETTRILCFVGDSLVQGIGDTHYQGGWCGRLCQSLEGDMTYFNLGIRRNTSRDIVNRWESECVKRWDYDDYDNYDGYEDKPIDGNPTEDSPAKASPHKRCYFILSCGVNDTVIEQGEQRISQEETLLNVTQIFANASTLAHCMMVSPLPVLERDHNQRIAMLNHQLKHSVRTQGIAYLDVFTQLNQDQEYLNALKQGDGYHPNTLGYERIAHCIRQSPDCILTKDQPNKHSS